MLIYKILFIIALFTPLVIIIRLFFLAMEEYATSINSRDICNLFDSFDKLSITEPNVSSLQLFLSNFSSKIKAKILNVRDPKIRIQLLLYSEFLKSQGNEKYIRLYSQDKIYAKRLNAKLNGINSAFFNGNIDETQRLLIDAYELFYYYEATCVESENDLDSIKHDSIFYETINTAVGFLRERSPWSAETSLSNGLKIITQSRANRSNTGLQIIILVNFLRFLKWKQPNFDMEITARSFKKIIRQYKRGDINGVYFSLEKLIRYRFT